MNNDTIYREDAIETLKENVMFEFTEDEKWAITCLQNLPSARPKGEWQVRFPYEDTGKIRTCSNCNTTQTVNVYDGMVRFKFCPYCGAKMKGADDD